MRPRAGWAFAVLVLVMAAGTSMLNRDIVPGARTVPGFTLFAVEADGLREPVAHFDGRRWRSPCEDAPAPPRPAAAEGQVVAIEATRDTPLFPVHELPRDAVHWEAAWRSVASGASVEAMDGWVREAHVYTVQDRPPATAFVDVSFRRSVDTWHGVSVSGWVALEPHSVRRLEARPHTFSSYDEYIALDRMAPLGVVHDSVTDARIWVMRTTGPQAQEIRVVELADGVRELIRVPRGACS
jgi:hypothetical protein